MAFNKRGEAVRTAVLTAAKVQSLKRMRAEGSSYSVLAATFGISRTQARRIVRGVSWAHVCA